MLFESAASALNLRDAPSGNIVGELLLGDRVDLAPSAIDAVWAPVKVASGLNAGRAGFVRRKWLLQTFDVQPQLANVDRFQAAHIIGARTQAFDAIHYSLGEKAKSWGDLTKIGAIDCSGWIYLLAKEILGAYQHSTKPSLLYTFSDQQITNVGKATRTIVSGRALDSLQIVPGCLLGVDFAEYSWDRNRPLDIDHIVIVGADANGTYVSQSSSSGGGVNRVALGKWLSSVDALRLVGRVHLVDLLQLP